MKVLAPEVKELWYAQYAAYPDGAFAEHPPLCPGLLKHWIMLRGVKTKYSVLEPVGVP
jgi:hypothetical protein